MGRNSQHLLQDQDPIPRMTRAAVLPIGNHPAARFTCFTPADAELDVLLSVMLVAILRRR